MVPHPLTPGREARLACSGLPSHIPIHGAHPADGMAACRIAFARGDGMWWDKLKTYNAAREIPTVDVASWLCMHRP